jgi:hypothetical protein
VTKRDDWSSDDAVHHGGGMKNLRRSLGSGSVFGGVLIVGLVAMWSLAGSAQADPSLGTWTLNLAKSKYSPGPPPQSLTITHEAAGDGVKVTAKGVDAEGKPISSEFTLKYDGKDYPVSGIPAWDAMSVKRVDAYTVDFTRKKAGKVVQTGTDVVAKDGKTRTITTTGTNAKGEKINNVAVFEKQ